MVTGFSHMKYGIFQFSFENLCAVFTSGNIEFYLFNIWKTFINFPTRNIEFANRFSCLSSEILSISINKDWMNVFWPETWNSVYFTFENLGINVLIWNINNSHMKHFLDSHMWNQSAGQEATARNGHRTTDWLQIGKGVRQSCICSLC